MRLENDFENIRQPVDRASNDLASRLFQNRANPSQLPVRVP